MKPKLPKSICSTPFLQMMLTPNGDVRVCCLRNDLVLGNIKKQSLLDDLWNHEKLQKLRREFIEDNPISCSQNIRRLGCNQRFSHLNKYIDLKEVQTKPPRKFDLRLNGQCNLECIMCSFWKQPNEMYNDSEFWTRGPSEIFPFLLHLELLGGEPFIQKDTYKLIDEVSLVNKNCQWSFTTNGHWNFNSSIVKKLDKIQIQQIRFSIDSVNAKTFKKIRINGDLDRLVNTIRKVREYKASREKQGRGFAIGFDMAVQILNAEEVPDFIKFSQEFQVDDIGLILVTHPDEHSILKLSFERRKEILAKYFECLKENRIFALESLVWSLKEELNYSHQMSAR